MELNEFEEYSYNKEIENNLFRKILTHPKEAFRFIVKHQYEKHLTVLLVLAGIANGFDRIVEKATEDSNIIVLLIMAVIVGALVGWIGYYIYAALLSLSGRWLNGKGRTNTILPILAYASVPAIAGTIFTIAQIFLFGTDSSIIETASMPVAIIYYLLLFLQLGFGFWTLALYAIGLAEVQQFAIWKAILNLLLPVLFIVVPLLLIFFLTTTTS